MRKSLEQRRENPPRAFVPELELPIESLVRTRHQELGRRQGARVHVAEELPEMQLGPRGTDWLGDAPMARPARSCSGSQVRVLPREFRRPRNPLSVSPIASVAPAP